MLSVFLRTLIVSLRCFHAASTTPSGQDVSLWFVGCVNTSSIQAFTPTSVRDLDPTSCYEGCQFTALSTETCYCGNQLHAPGVSTCFNSSLREETIDVKEGSEKQSPIYYLLLGYVANGFEESESLNRSKEPFFLYKSVLACLERVQAGRRFGVRVPGKLTGCWKQTADVGTSFSTLRLSVPQLSPCSLVIYLLRSSPDTPPVAHLGSNRNPAKAVTVSLQADMRKGVEVLSCWGLMDKHQAEILEDVEENCPSSTNCLKSILVVVCPFMSNLRLDVSDSKLTGGDAELLKLILEAESNHSSENLKGCICTEKCYNHELCLDSTTGVTANQTYLVSFNVSAESVVTVSLLVNATVKYKSSSCTTGAEATVVLLFTHCGTVVIQLRAENQVSLQNKSVRMFVKGKRKSQAKGIKTGQPSAKRTEEKEQQVYPTNKDIIFLAVTDIPDPVEFLWDFGDSKLARTSLRTITKRYHNPGRYNVVVAASWGQMSITSDGFPIDVQRAVKLSRLVHQALVLRNQALTITCRVNVGTNLTFMWSFGDGKTRPGLSTTHHVFHRLGEFMIKVTASNLISSASLSSHVFVVDRPCQPPPVKNMGPLKLQFQRHEVIHLGVTFETDVNCDISKGLHYSWTLFGSRSRIISLPHTDTQTQSLILQSHLLQYDTYVAIARVQVIGSMVYSNYTVSFQVNPSPPVAFIQGGTNVFIGKNSSNVVTLDGQKSYDPDFPNNPLSYSWTCKPVSTIISSCFDQEIPTSSPVLTFPTSTLKPKFDQFQFTLTVHSGERSASSEAFLTVTSHLTGRISAFCHQCQGDHLNWDQSFSVRALCEDCKIRSELIQYAWSLYLVNSSSKPIKDVPFCYTVDVNAPAALLENPTPSALTPGMSSLHPPVPDVSQNQWDESDQSDSSGSERSHTSVLDQDGKMLSDHISLSGISDEIPSESSADWRYAFPLTEKDFVADQQDYDVPFPSVEEGDPGMPAGRSNDAESFNPVNISAFDRTVLNNEGSNLVDHKPGLVVQEPTLLDLHRDAVENGLFQSYTYTGISSNLLIFRPFSLKPSSIYMLQVTAKSQDNTIGKTQLFLKTNPVPEGMRCQVQPVEGMELHTPFSIFCTSGREDLEYKYSFSVGGRPPRTLYQGRDFQYYFSLPSGDPKDDYEVRIYTEIRSSSFGSGTKPCAVTVRVRPSFLRDSSSSSSSQWDPALKLSESLKNLASLIQRGNTVEIRNYINLLTGVLKRLRQDPEANTHAQRHTRNVLICALCDFKGHDQISIADSVFTLNELLQVTNQVTIMSVRHVASYVRSVSAMLPEIRPDQEMLYSLINSLSYCLRVVICCSCTPEAPDNPNNADVLKAGSLKAQNIQDSENASDRHAQNPSNGPHLQHGGVAPTKRLVQLVEEILQTAADLMLSHILAHEAKQHTVSAGLITLHASLQNRTSTIFRSGFTAVRMPAALIQSVLGLHTGRARLREQHPCVFRVLTELSHNQRPRETCPPQLDTGSTFILTSFSQMSGPVVDLSLFKCSTRRKIHIGPLLQPINIEVQLPQRNESSTDQYTLLRHQVNYHSFSISQEILQRAIQMTVLFTPPSRKPFPIMLLFRMFERPTPSIHHLKRIHQWEQNTVRLTLPPSYLNAAGIAHIALLDARLAKRKIQSEQISYSLTVDSSLCLSWDGQQGAWTHHGCTTHQTDTSSTVNCSCYQLRPLTVFQQPIQSSMDTGDLDPFLSGSSNTAVLSILAMVLVLYILGLVWSKRADVLSKENQRAYYLSDNNPADPYLYAVCIHTGLCSATRMTAKVYIVLYGENGCSETKELGVPGCTLFRRNTTDTFILSAADSLGPVWGVHIWHDNSGPSPDWYLKKVVVSEVSREQVKARRSWLFVSECWLAVNRGDGQVERMLRVCSQEMHLVKMLFLRCSDYLADFHMWHCVYSCPSPSSYTHTQRLSVCLLLLLGYSCANTVIITCTNDQLPFEVGIAHISAVSVTTGLLSVMVVLPVATLISVLFRLTGKKLMGSRVRHANCIKTAQGDFQEVFSVSNGQLDYHLSCGSCKRWAREALRKKYQERCTPSVSSFHENKGMDEESATLIRVAGRNDDFLLFEGSEGLALHELLLISQEHNCNHTSEGKAQKQLPERGQYETYTAGGNADQWVGKKLRTARLWCRSLGWTLCVLLSLSCLVVTARFGMSFSSNKVLLWIHSLFVSLSSCMFIIQPALIFVMAMAVSLWYKTAAGSHCLFGVRKSQIETNLWSKYDAYEPEQFTISAVCEKTSVEKQLLKARERARHLRLTHPPTPAELRKARRKRKREALIHETLRNFIFCAIMLLLMVCIISGSSVKDHQNLNKAIKRHFTWNNSSFTSIKTHEEWWKWTQSSLLDFLYQNSTERLHIVLGEPILQKTDRSNIFKNPMLTNPPMCDHPSSEKAATVSLGHKKSEAASKLKNLHSSYWIDRWTVALKVQFTLYSPVSQLLSSVSLITEQSPDGILLHSAKIQSLTMLHTPDLWDYVVVVCKLLFLFLSLLQCRNQVSIVSHQGLMGSWRRPCMWLNVSLLPLILACYLCCIYHSTMIVEVVSLLQTQHGGHADVSAAADWEQNIRILLGIIFFLLTMKCVTVLGENRTLSSSVALFSHSFSTLLYPVVSGLILLLALSCSANLLYADSSWAFSSVPRSLLTLLCHFRGIRFAKSRLHSQQDFSHWNFLFLTTTAVWTAMVIGVISSSVKTAKRSQSRSVTFTTGELLCYVRLKVSEFTGWQRKARLDDYEKKRINPLEELESSIDELLFRLDVLSSSMHHPLRAHCYRQEASPVLSASPLSYSMEAQIMVKQPKARNKVTLESHEGTSSSAPHLFSRSKVEMEIQNISEGTNEMLKIENWLESSVSTTIEKLEEEDVCDNQPVLQAGTNGSWFTAAHTKVVEVLIHKEPGTAEP